MKARWIVLAIAAGVIGCGHMHADKESEENEGTETEMKLSEIPAPARDALVKEAGGAQITTVDKEEKDGKTVYETDVKIDGKEWEIAVDANGQLVSKKQEEDDGEKDEDDEKEKK